MLIDNIKQRWRSTSWMKMSSNNHYTRALQLGLQSSAVTTTTKVLSTVWRVPTVSTRYLHFLEIPDNFAITLEKVPIIFAYFPSMFASKFNSKLIPRSILDMLFSSTSIEMNSCDGVIESPSSSGVSFLTRFSFTCRRMYQRTLKFQFAGFFPMAPKLKNTGTFCRFLAITKAIFHFRVFLQNSYSVLKLVFIPVLHKWRKLQYYNFWFFHNTWMDGYKSDATCLITKIYWRSFYIKLR